MSQTLDVTFTNLSQLSRAYGAPAVSLAERVIQKTAEGNILVGISLIVVGFLLLWVAFLSVFRVNEINNPYKGATVGYQLLATLSAMGMFGVWGVSFVFLHDIWQWTALTDPNLALAHQVFGSMQRGY